MISNDLVIRIEDWAKKRDSKDAKALTILAIEYIKENHLDWDTTVGKAKVISYIDKFYFGTTKQNISFNDEWIGHQTENNLFELLTDDFFSSDLNIDADNDSNTPEIDKTVLSYNNLVDTESDINNYTNKIESSDFTYEIKELLRVLYDNANKSHYLTNFNSQGRIKLIRKAKILAFLHKTGKK
jgi:hypothetical protein